MLTHLARRICYSREPIQEGHTEPELDCDLVDIANRKNLERNTMTFATAFWRRIDVPGRDAASIREAADGFQLLGQAVFLDPRGPVALRYVLDLARDWSTLEGHISGFVGDRKIDDRIIRTASGWTLNGQNRGMADIVDLDLGFTPATNMIQLKRIALDVGRTSHFDVAWLEAGDTDLQRLPQTYYRANEFDYSYESPQGDYRATIVLDQTGFASKYPGLWESEL